MSSATLLTRDETWWRRPRTGAGQAMPATLTRRHMEPLEQAGSRYAELMRLNHHEE